MARFDANNYIDVQERIVRFWSEHPDGSIITRLMSPPDDFGQCRYEATVFKRREDQRPSATGYAFEIAGGVGPNATSHEENCETSAIGRALANMGYATTRDDRPSRQEMQKVERAEASPPRPAPRRNALPAGPGNGSEPESWQTFWAWARPNGFQRLEQIQSVMPEVKVHELTPGQLRAAVEDFLAEVKQTS